MAKMMLVVFNDDVPQEKVDEAVDGVCELLAGLDVTAVTFVGEAGLIGEIVGDEVHHRATESTEKIQREEEKEE